MNLARVFLVLLVLSLHATALASTPEPTATVLFDIAIERATGETKVYLKADGVNDIRRLNTTGCFGSTMPCQLIPLKEKMRPISALTVIKTC